MNPKTADLDPKLKETYERVMGTVTPTASNMPQASTDTPKPQTQVVTAKNRGRLSPILLAIVIVLFFIIYTFVWTIVFKLKLPFLP
ncbi:MAG: hypothetical protein A3B44_00455 [Candidatus Levybacteria bacterium RIFCSPLOWO2_01_FULL_38_21]|nr:MAG: hypothetical protein A3B44_00455 [Candidatus Levybacteria bacterium RIFCSPLOWO2_01_FULL_38_21]